MKTKKHGAQKAPTKKDGRRALAVGTCSTAVREAIQALDLADAVLNAVVAYREYIPRDIAIQAATVRNICQAAAHELRQPPSNARGLPAPLAEDTRKEKS